MARNVKTRKRLAQPSPALSGILVRITANAKVFRRVMLALSLIAIYILAEEQGLLGSSLIVIGLFVPAFLSSLFLNRKPLDIDVMTMTQEQKSLRRRSMLGNTPEAIVLLDAESCTFIDANDNALDLFGYPLSELVEMGPADISPHTQPSGISSQKLATQHVQEALDGERTIFEWTHQHRNGKEIPCEVQLVRIENEDGAIVRGSLIDITPRKEYEWEQKTRAISENERTEELASLAIAGASIASSLDVSKVLQIVAQQLTHLLNVQIAIISDWNRENSKLTPRLEYLSRVNAPRDRNFTPVSIAEKFDAAKLMQGTKPLQAHHQDYNLDKVQKAAFDQAGIASVLLFPLMAQSKTIGLIEMQDTRSARRFSEHQIYLAQTLCHQAAIAIENARLFQESQRQIEELTILKEVAAAGTEATSEDELIERCTELIKQSLFPDNFGILLVDRSGKQLSIHPSYEVDKSIKENRIQMGQGVTGRVAASGKALRITDTRLEEDYLSYAQDTRSELCVPMKIGGRIIGVVNAESNQKGHFTAEDERLLATFADQLSSGIERLRREAAEKERTKHLTVLNQLAGQMGGILERHQLFELVVGVLHKQMDYFSAYVFSVDEANEQLVLEAVAGAYKNSVPQNGYQQALGDGLLGLAARTGETVVSNNVKEDPEYLQIRGGEKINSELIIPIKNHKKVVALLNVDCEKINAFEEAQISALQTLADQIAISLESISLFDATRRQLQELTVIHAIANAAVGARSEDELLERATEVIGATLYPDKFGFLLMNENGETMRVHHSYRGIDEETKKYIVQVNQGIAGRVVRTGKPARIPDVRQDEDYLNVNPQMRSELCVPIMAGQKVLGVINTESAELDAFTDADMRLLSTIAGQLGNAIEKLRLFASERLLRGQAETLQEVAAILGAATDNSNVLDLILDQLKLVVPFDSASIQIVDKEFMVIGAVAGNLTKKNLGFKLNISDDRLAHPIIYNHETVLNGDISNHPDWLKGPGTDKVKSWIGAPLIARGECVGVLTVDGYETNQFTESDARLVSAFAIHAGIAIENNRLFEELQSAYLQTVSALANAIDVRDSYTSGHSQRLADLAVETGRLLGCNEEDLENVRWAALLHDIGKIGVPDDILRKPSALNFEEMEVIRQHPEIGERIVRPVKKLAGVAPIIRAHQECFDGSGYPDGLEGQDIPLVARVISVVDAYVAMTDERVYRDARSHQEAIEELKRCAGSQFDPEVVDVFLQAANR